MNRWVGVVWVKEEEYEGKMGYWKEGLKGGLRMENVF